MENNYHIDTPHQPLPPPLPVPSPAGPWGFWATMGFSVILGLAYILVIIVVLTGLTIVAKVQDPQLNIEVYIESLAHNGFALSLCTIAATPICVGLMILFAIARSRFPMKDYLGLKLPRMKELVIWLSIVAAFLLITEGLSYVLGNSEVPDFMVEMYNTARSIPILFLAIVVAAPILEELFFRGFLFEGIRHSRLGAAGALIITSLVWASLHTQYGFSEIQWIFFWGIILGWARLKTGSTLLAILLHGIGNLIAMIQLVIHLK